MKIRMRLLPVKSAWGFVLAIVCCILLATSVMCAAEATNPQHTGAEVLKEILLGSKQFLVRVGSNGYTDKSFFTVTVKKEQGLSGNWPHYTLTILRTKPDEGKAIVADGTLILFDLEKDLGCKGAFTYSVTNKVLAAPQSPSSDGSLFSIIEKYFTLNFPEIKETRPEPFDKFVMDHDYFVCYLPSAWKTERNQAEDEKDGIFEVILTKPSKAGPADIDKQLLPDPLIQVAYYTKDNQQQKTYESFIRDYHELVLKKEGSDKSRYEKPKEFLCNGKEAVELNYEVNLSAPMGPLASTNYWLKAKFIVIKAKEGFYALVYKSPLEFYDKYLSVFEETVNTFQPLY